jgi:hypothetical protein
VHLLAAVGFPRSAGDAVTTVKIKHDGHRFARRKGGRAIDPDEFTG